jgi:hypothetical protein
MSETNVLIANDGKVAAFIVGVGGLIGAGAKDAAVPFSDVKGTEKNDKCSLTMNASKDTRESVLPRKRTISHRSAACRDVPGADICAAANSAKISAPRRRERAAPLTTSRRRRWRRKLGSMLHHLGRR